MLEDRGGWRVLPEVDSSMRVVPLLTAVCSPDAVLMARVEGRHGRNVDKTLGDDVKFKENKIDVEKAAVFWCSALATAIGGKFSPSLSGVGVRNDPLARSVSLIHPSSDLFGFSCQLESSNGQSHQAWRGFFLA